MRQVELIFGYKGADGVLHKSVEIGKRVTCADLMRIGDLPESESELQFNLMLLGAAITKFGTLPVPVPLTVLLSLNSVDRQDLRRAYEAFVEKESEGGNAVRLDVNRLRLAHGFTVGGVRYDVVEFGRLLSGYDELEGEELSQWRKAFFLLGKQITHLSQSDGESTLDGPVNQEHFETLFDRDAYELTEFAKAWRNSFRHPKRVEVQEDAGSPGAVSDATPASAGG